MADIKHRDGKWFVVSDEKDLNGHPKREEECTTKEEAEKRLKEWEWFKDHKKAELLELIHLADKLDNLGFFKEANLVDELIKKF